MKLTVADQYSFMTKDWQPIPRIGRTIPFGYEIDPNNSDVLKPNIFELEALEKAKLHLKNHFSYRDVAQWLTITTGRYISHMGLKKRLENERKRHQRVAGIKRWTKRVEEAKVKAEAILSQRTGAGKPLHETAQYEFDFGE